MGTNTEIHFLPIDKNHTHTLSRDTKHLRQDAFSGGFFRRCKTTRVYFMACVAPEEPAWGAKLILTAGLAYPVSCASLGHLLMAQHYHLWLSVCFSLPTPYRLNS